MANKLLQPKAYDLAANALPYRIDFKHNRSLFEAPLPKPNGKGQLSCVGCLGCLNLPFASAPI